MKWFVGRLAQFTERLAREAGEILLQFPNWMSWRRQALNRLTERPLEYGFAMNSLSEVCPRTVLDVGSGRSPWPALLSACGFHVTAIDAPYGYWRGRLRNPCFHVIEEDITAPDISRTFEFATCISVMEHIREHEKAFAGIVALLEDGGHAVLSFPYCEHQYIPNVYELPDAGYGQDFGFICQSFSRRELDAWLAANRVDLLSQEYYRVFSGPYWTVGERVVPFRRVARTELHQLTAILIRKQETESLSV